jgi:hypothetical protein
MALDVYFREDIANILRSADIAGASTAGIVHREIEKALRRGQPIETADLADSLELYQQGYRDALGAMAAAFGILPDQVPGVDPEMLLERNAQQPLDSRYVTAAWRLKQEMPV